MSADGSGGDGRYDGLTHAQLVELLERRDRQKKLGLVWERDEIEADRALEAEFVAADLLTDRSDPAKGAGGWPNLVIESDNYDALRWLRMTLAGRVKCIYVDPPYNTGAKDWVYNDHYVSKEDRWRHSTWLEFLYRRFTLARDLLTEDGVILVSINDENRAKLELMLDEVLPGMRVGSLVWRTRDTTAATKNNLSDVHEHILVYASPTFVFSGSEKSKSKYKNPDSDPRGPWNVDPLTLAFDRLDRPNLFYPIRNPETDTWYPCDPDRVWCFASEARLKPGQKTRSDTMEENIRQQRIVFPSQEATAVWNNVDEVRSAIISGNAPVTPRDRKPLLDARQDLEFWVRKKVGFGRPGVKKFWSDLNSHVSPLSTWVARLGEAGSDDLTLLRTGSGGEGTNEVQRLFGDKRFNYPKPVSLVRQLVEQATSSGDIVLDFFAGSATTAQAVMQLNAEDGGERRFVMVSSTEATAEEPDKNLCDAVTAERVRRLNASDDPAYAALNAPFAYLRMRRLKWENLDYDLTGAEVWAALETLHGLPLTPYDADAAWVEHESEGVTVILVERIEDALVMRLKELSARRAPAFAYAWAPGQVTAVTGALDIEVRGVRETLVGRFRA